MKNKKCYRTKTTRNKIQLAFSCNAHLFCCCDAQHGSSIFITFKFCS